MGSDQLATTLHAQTLYQLRTSFSSTKVPRKQHGSRRVRFGQVGRMLQTCKTVILSGHGPSAGGACLPTVFVGMYATNPSGVRVFQLRDYRGLWRSSPTTQVASAYLLKLAQPIPSPCRQPLTASAPPCTGRHGAPVVENAGRGPPSALGKGTKTHAEKQTSCLLTSRIS